MEAVARDARRRLLDETELRVRRPAVGQRVLLPRRADSASMLFYAIDAIVPPAQGTRSEPDGKDMRYMLRLLDIIESEGIPAPAPIEQRWTAGSSSLLSPARSTAEDALFSWVGIIMYCQRRLTHAVDAPRLHLRPRLSQVPTVRRRKRAAVDFRRVPAVQGAVRDGVVACLWCPRALGEGRGRFKRARAAEEALR